MTRSLVLAIALVPACNSSHAPSAPSGPDASVGSHADGGAGGDAPLVDGGVTGDAPADAFVDRGVEQDYDDLATTLAGAMRSTQLQAMVDGINTVYAGGQLAGFTQVQPGELSGTRGAVSYDYMFHCEDQQAHDNFTCGPASDHIHWMATIDGPVMVDQLSFAELKLTSHWTIREIYLDKPRVEGTDRMLLDATLASDGTRFQLTVDGTFTHLRLDPQPTVPFAGSFTYAVTATRTRQTANPAVRSYTAGAAVNFVGPGKATIELDGTHTYMLDMATGGVTRM